MASKKDSKTLIFVGLPIVLIILVVGGYAVFGSGDQPATAQPQSSQTAEAADDEFVQSDSPRRVSRPEVFWFFSEAGRGDHERYARRRERGRRATPNRKEEQTEEKALSPQN